MQIEETKLNDLFLLKPKIFNDSRGFFYESWNASNFRALTGVNLTFVQDNQSYSKKNVLRGLGYQINKPQGKLVRVIHGSIYDVVVDLRRSSSTFGKWFGVALSSENNYQLWVPPGFAHGFITKSEYANVLFKVTDYFSQKDDRCIKWDDPELSIDWEIKDEPLVSEKDREGVLFSNAVMFD